MATHRNEEVPQQAPATNENNTIGITQAALQNVSEMSGETRDDLHALKSVSEIMKDFLGIGGDGFVPIVWKGGTAFLGTKIALTALRVSNEYVTPAAAAVTAVEVMPYFVEWWRKRFGTTGQCRLRDGATDEQSVLQEATICGEPGMEHTYECNKPGYIFTGFSCLPLNREIPSPNAQVSKGGINCSYVTIRLTPAEKRNWACRVVVFGRLSTEESKQTAPADICASGLNDAVLSPFAAPAAEEEGSIGDHEI